MLREYLKSTSLRFIKTFSDIIFGCKNYTDNEEVAGRRIYGVRKECDYEISRP